MDIQKTISQMTLEEKASLLSGLRFWHTKPIERLGIKSVMVSDGPHGLRGLCKKNTNEEIANANHAIKAVCFPAGCASTASFDRNLVREIGENLGDACQHEEIGVLLGPAINIKRSPLCGRNFEYLSEDPYLAGEMAASIVKGIQSRNVGVSVKHFAANNQEHRRMSSDSVISERALREIYLPAFEKVVKQARPWTIMCSYNKLNGEYASQNRRLLTDLLRGEWGFDGYVMSDWGAVSSRVKSLHAGLDLEMPSSNGFRDALVVKAVREGTLEEKDVDQAVERILTVNQRYLDNAKPDTPWNLEAQHELARKFAAECMVLLKNDDDILPLREGQRIALIGKFAQEPRFQGGGSSHINCQKVTGLKEALEGVPGVCYAQGYRTDRDETDADLLTEARKAAQQADVAVIVAGLPEVFESEGYDRAHLSMPTCQIELIREIAKVNPNVAVVLYNGSPVEMPWLDCAKAVVEAYLGGENVGSATKDILFGDVNPSGRLPESFPLRLEDTPCYLSYGGEGNTAVYQEDLFVGYRYYTKKKQPVLFPFGYGLSYTRFEYANLKLSADSIQDTDELSASVDVTNVGTRRGKEVVQLYVAAGQGSVIRPLRELKGFEKIELLPGETKTVTFRLNKRSFAYWNVSIHNWHVETGDYEIQICRDCQQVALSQKVFVKGETLKPVFTVDTIFLDIYEDPIAWKKAASFMKKMVKAFGMGSGTGDAENLKEAMSELQYLPLRGILCFASYGITPEDVQKLLEDLNS